MMAQCKLTPREFIGNAFSPQIGAVCSNIAESVCQKNNLSFIELLQPFCNLNTEGHFKDPQGTTVGVRNLRLSIQDIHAQPPEPSVARKMLNDSVSMEPCERVTIVTIANVDLDIPLAVPWFEAWREMFLAVQFPSDHEFTKHFLACMIVVSTGDENPLEKIQQMATQLHQSVPGKLPKWFNNNALRYYVLIHDSAQDDRTKAEAVFTEMKNLYDANNCFLLQMNSRPPGHADDNTHLPDPWSQFLVKHTDFNASSDHSSSPRTPADMGGVSAMPNEVTTEPDKSSHAGTPIAPQNPALLSPDIADKLSLSSEISEGPNMHVEMGQEAVPVTIHPLSPEGHRDLNAEIGRRSLALSGSMGNSDSTPINANVWADSPNHPVAQHGSRLSTQDLDRLRNMINEFCLKSLLPYVEKQIGLLSDVISNKKGVSRSLFSATKRWFGTSKPGAPGSTPTNAVIYTSESPELQLRRLGDLCFMFGHYTLAYQAYHSAKRDFAADQAWLYYAGALEMAALSAFMQGEMTRKTIEYMDDAILTYSNSCKMPQFATRATLLSAECLKGRNLHGEAAKQLIRMTSEDSDLRSALLLEQAAYCFISPRMIHKYAFHAVLAGHRFSKAGQRKHSLRCYQQAYQVYRDRGWSSAEDHIHFTIGRQAASLKQVGDAVRAFEKLLNESSRQPSAQQAAFLREFLHTHHLLLQENTRDRSEIPVLPLPLVNGNEIRVLLGYLPTSTNERIAASNVSFENVDEDESRWTKLEEVIVAEAQGSSSMIFKPTIALYTNRTNNSLRPNAVLEEPINLSIELYNPMKISIPLTRVKLLWYFSSGNECWSNERIREESTEAMMPVDTEILESVVLQPSSKRRIILSCTPRRTGDLKITGISYDLSNPSTSDQPIVNPMVAVTGKRIFEIKGPRLKNVKEKPGANMYGVDNRLDINVVDRSPLMKVTFTKISQDMLCGEMQKLDVVLENVGQAPLKNIHVGSTNPKLFCLENNNEKSDSAVTKIDLPDFMNLQPGSKHTIALWIRAPHIKGNHRLDLLFYWENVDSKSTPKYRLCRHTWQLTVLDSIQISAIARRSAVRKADLPTLTLTVRVKNTNQSNDSFMNEISLDRVSLESKAWSLLECIVEPSNIRIQPQETYSVLLKLVRKIEESSKISDISLIKKIDETDEGVTRFPYINFIQKRHIKPQINNEISNDNQFRNFEEPSPLAVTTRLDATLILRWRAKVTESGNSARHAIGQHHVDLAVVNKSYKQPEGKPSDQNDYSTRLKIFGPDRNVSDSTTVIKKDDVPESEYLKNIISFSMNHVREGKHNFDRSRMCIIPVNLHLQNHSQSRIDVRIDTIGTSSQTSLPSLKSQLYSPQASTFFRYVSHTAIKCHVDALGVNTIKLQAIIPSPGTYDLSSRLEVSARVSNSGEFVLQKWRMESACSISHSSV